MEVYLRYALTSEEVGVEVGEFDTIGQFRENAAQEFGCDAGHVELHMDGVSIGDDEELVSAASCLTHASVVDVVVSMDVFVEHIRNGTRSYTDLPDSVQRDIPCALAALQSNRTEFRHLPPEVQTHPTIVEHVTSVYIFETAHPSAWNDKDFRWAVFTATSGGCLSWDCCEDFRSDRDTVFACVKRDGRLLEYASGELKKCPVIVLASVQCCASAIQYAAEEVRADQEIFTAAVVGGVWEPTWLPEALRADRGLAMRCVRMWSNTLRAFSDEVRGDQFVVAAARSLEYASEDLKKDKDFAISCVGRNYENLKHVHESLQSDRDVVMAAIACHKGAFCYACNSIRDDPELALQCSIECPNVARHYGETLCQDKGFIMSAVRENADVFLYLKGQWQDDEDVAKLAVEASPDNFCYCSDTLRDNHAFVLFAVQKGANLWEASDALRSDTELCRAAPEAEKSAAAAHEAAEAAHQHDLMFAPPALRDDFEFVKKAVSTRGSDLQYASPALQDTYDIVLAAVQHSCEGFLYASPRLRKCETLAREALGHMSWSYRNGISSSTNCLKFLGTYLLDDKAFILSLARPDVIIFVSKRLQADRDVVLSCMHQYGSYLLSYASSDLRDDRAVVEAAVTSTMYNSALSSTMDNRGLVYASPRLRRDHSLVLLAVTTDGHSLQYACSDLQNNIDIVRAAVAQNWDSLMHANRTLLHTTDIVHSVLPEHPQALQYASAEVRNDVSIVGPLAKKDVQCLSYAGPAVLSDRAFILFAVQQNPVAMQYASQELHDDPDIAAALIEHPAGREVPPLSPELLGNKDFMMKAIAKHPSWFLNASVRLQNDPAFIMACLDLYDERLDVCLIGDRLWCDTDVVTKAIATAPTALHRSILEIHKHKTLFANRAFMLECVRRDASNLQYASEALQDDVHLVLEALRSKVASPRLQRDHSLVLLAVTTDGHSLQYACSDLQNNIDIVRAAVAQNWDSLQYADRTLLHTTDIVHSVLPEHPQALQYASAEVRNDVSIVGPLAKKDVQCLSYAGPAVLSDRAFILSAVQQNPVAMQYASQELHDDPDIAAALIEHPAGREVPPLSPELLGNKDFMMKAIAKHPSWFLNASVRLQNDPAFVLLVVRKQQPHTVPYIIQHAGAGVRGDYNTMLEVVTKCSGSLENASRALRNNLDIVTAAVLKDPHSFEYASAALRNCKRVAMLAMRGWARNLSHASEALQNDPEVVLCCITQNEDTIQYAGPIRDSYRFAVKAVRKEWSVFERLSSTLRTNPNFILACINDKNKHMWKDDLCSSAWAHTGLVMRLLPALGGRTVMMQAGEKVRRKFKVALACVGNDMSILDLVPLQLRESKDFIMACLDLEGAKDRLDVSLIGDRLWCDADVVTKAIATAPTALHRSILEIHKHKPLFANRAFMLECVRRDASNLQYASEALQDDVHLVLEALRSKVSAAAFASPAVLRHPRVRALLWGHTAVLAGWLAFIICNRFTKPLTQVEDYHPLGM